MRACTLETSLIRNCGSNVHTLAFIYAYLFQFYVGAAGTGAPVHFHNAAWNALVYGKKAWILVPPALTYFSTVPAAEMVETLAKSDAALAVAKGAGVRSNLRCVQEAGDVVFLAQRWGHLTYNLAASIGLAKEFTPFPWKPPRDTRGRAPKKAEKKREKPAVAGLSKKRRKKRLAEEF